MVEQDIPPTSQLAAIPGLPIRDFKQRLHDTLAAVGLALVVFVLYLLPAQWRGLEETAEARVALVARNMIKTGDWLVPRIGDEPRLNKPPLPYWLVAASATALGEDEAGRKVSVFATVLPSALFGAACVFLVVLIGTQVFGRAAGVWAGILLGLSSLFVSFSQMGTGEIILTFFTTAALIAAAWIACMPRPGLVAAIAFGVSLGLAILTKWHIPALFVCGALLVDAIRQRTFNTRKTLLVGLGFVIALMVALPWCLFVQSAQPEATSVMWKEMWDAVEVAGHDQNDRWFYYLYHFLHALLPWTPVLFLTWPTGWHRIRTGRSQASPSGAIIDRFGSFFAGAALLGFLGLYAVSKQQYYYLLPLIPAMALAAGNALAQFNRPGDTAEEALAWAHLAFGIVLGVGISITPMWIEPLIYGVSIPMGILTLILCMVASRQWVEGNPLSAGLSLGLAAYAILIGWALLSTLHDIEDVNKNFLVRECESIRKKLQDQPPSVRLYSFRPGPPKERLLYYLDRDQLAGRKELIKDFSEEESATHGQTHPPRFLICDKARASQLGYGESSDRLHLLYVTPQIIEELKKCQPETDPPQ